MEDDYEVIVGTHFDAAHWLPDYPGPCARLHGHRWRVEAAVRGGEPGDSGMVIDFMQLKAWLREIASVFDHRCLNEIEPFTAMPPTSENLARHLFHALAARIEAAGAGVRLSWVSVAESPDTRVVYRGT